MGGRRSYSLKDVVGSGKNIVKKKAQLTKSFKSSDISGVSKNSANLVIEHHDIAKIFLYSKKLYESLIGKYKADELKNLKDINRKVRIDWSIVKSNEKLVSNSIVDSAVVDSVSKVLKEKA